MEIPGWRRGSHGRGFIILLSSVGGELTCMEPPEWKREVYVRVADEFVEHGKGGTRVLATH
jgi:hypothetical protein